MFGIIGFISFVDIRYVTHLMCGGKFSLSNSINGLNSNPTPLSPVKNPNCSSYFFLRSKILNSNLWQTIFYSILIASSDRSFMDQSSSSTLLNIQLNQNMVSVLDPLKYSQLVQPFIVFLNHSILKKAMVMVEDVLIY